MKLLEDYSAQVTLLIECRLSYVFHCFSLPSITFYHPQRKSWEGMFSQVSVCPQIGVDTSGPMSFL